MKIAFIGLGIMGSRMATNLIKAGETVSVYNRTSSASNDLVSIGASTSTDLGSVVRDSDVVITMLSTHQVVMDCAFGEVGFVSKMPKGSIWIDCTTVNRDDSLASARLSNELGIRFLEAPVAGTKQPAENGELVFFVGGSDQDLKEVEGLFEIMGKKTVHMGEHGNAAAIKMLINLLLAQSMVAFSEAVTLGIKLGLPQELIHRILTNSPVAAPFLQNVIGKLESEDRSANFPLEWMLKDLNLIIQAARDTGLKMESAEVTQQLFAQRANLAREDFSSIYHTITEEKATISE